MKASILSLTFVLAGLASAQVPAYGQCGGQGYTGSRTCVSGFTCVVSNDWYSQCVPGSGGGGSNPTPNPTPTSTRVQTPTPSPPPSTGGGSPPAGLIGFATQNGGTTGGGNAASVTVTSCSALKAAVSGTAASVIRVSGQLSGCGVTDVGSNKSILGVGANSGIINGGLRIRKNKNVIIRNLRFTPCAKCDALAIDQSTNVWVDHCDFSSLGLVGGKDDYDGLLDVSHAANFVTISWNRFRNHWKGSLVGHSDNNGSEDRGFLKVTYHHNLWDNVNSRCPSVRFGTAHILNNYYKNIPTSGINSRMGANVLVEGNVFENVKLAVVTNLDSDQDGFATERNNLFLAGSTTRITAGSSFSPPYSYSVQSASGIASTVSSGSGTGVISV